ncbi:hypothetical protein DID80_06165 [Candidatus Marinamargulisbacteria bacterium SCGC AAA071-K20]|nr:hypothetical protein DID80_06165 [Candidatus Marinamargulisbacteria bacterium SCGC AAA071-K20]
MKKRHIVIDQKKDDSEIELSFVHGKMKENINSIQSKRKQIYAQLKPLIIKGIKAAKRTGDRTDPDHKKALLFVERVALKLVSFMLYKATFKIVEALLSSQKDPLKYQLAAKIATLYINKQQYVLAVGIVKKIDPINNKLKRLLTKLIIEKLFAHNRMAEVREILTILERNKSEENKVLITSVYHKINDHKNTEKTSRNEHQEKYDVKLKRKEDPQKNPPGYRRINISEQRRASVKHMLSSTVEGQRVEKDTDNESGTAASSTISSLAALFKEEIAKLGGPGHYLEVSQRKKQEEVNVLVRIDEKQIHLVRKTAASKTEYTLTYENNSVKVNGAESKDYSKRFASYLEKVIEDVNHTKMIVKVKKVKEKRHG